MSQPPPPATGEPEPLSENPGTVPPAEPAPSTATTEPHPEPHPEPASAPTKDENPLRSSRTSGAWTGVVVALVLILLLVVFVLQNTDSAPVEFLWLDGNAPVAVLLLIAAAVGMAIAALVGSLRIMQLRRRIKRERRR
ncbi:hypothetical protein GCM10023340_40660 [Nocardioides marinquilinus]|uniref:Lipopolysaccharide assembly protein A domain-containing protein n=1 Tax=Nocardioides marinquilinus TaxID=1210400 RepID=A0ABP9Q157_9ACTN